MQHSEMRFGMTLRVMREGARDSFRAGHSEVVEDVAVRGMREISVNDVFCKVGAVARDSIEVIFVRERVKLRDDVEVLRDARLDDEEVHAPRQSGANHLPPFGLVAL